MPDLTEDDYNALFFAMQIDMPQLTRSSFPQFLEQSVRDGTTTIVVTEEEVVVQTQLVSGGAGYSVERRRKLH